MAEALNQRKDQKQFVILFKIMYLFLLTDYGQR